jgi:hypothetical protein
LVIVFEILLRAFRSSLLGGRIKNPGQAFLDSVFYNPIQQFNRDLSVLAIRAHGEHIIDLKKQKALCSAFGAGLGFSAWSSSRFRFFSPLPACLFSFWQPNPAI